MHDNIYYVPPRTQKLISPYEAHPGGRPILPAQPFTAGMLSVVVAEDLDGLLRGRNDVMVLSRSSMGEEPFVDRIHCYEEEIPKGKPIKNLFAETVFVEDDYPGERLWLELDVIEVDTSDAEREAAVQAFRTLAATAGSVFPAILPYTFAASAAAGLLDKLVDVFERDEHVVRVPLALYPGEGSVGRASLRAGIYVAFAQPQDPARFKLRANGTLALQNGRPADVSYAAFDIRPQKQVSPEFVITQKMATLLTQIRAGNPNSPVATLEFVRDTISQYGNFKKLTRYLELSKEASRSAEEDALMAEIAKIPALAPFLPEA